jgi:capsular polysaccharide biosynthesis protein
LSAAGWFITSMVLCLIGAYVSLLTVTPYKARNAFVAIGFVLGIFVGVTFLFLDALHANQ